MYSNLDLEFWYEMCCLQAPPDGVLLGQWTKEVPRSHTMFGFDPWIVDLGLPGFGVVIHGFFTSEYCDVLREAFNEQRHEPVGVDGYVAAGELPGSHRATAWDVSLATAITTNLVDKKLVPYERRLNSFSPVNNIADTRAYGSAWLLGASPVFRFMKYKSSGRHCVHYDAPYISPKNSKVRTLMSTVAFLDSCESGHLSFVDDGQWHKSMEDRDTKDWSADTQAQMLASIRPRKGSLVIFDHYLPHEVLPFVDGENAERNIIRGDLFYELGNPLHTF